MEAIFYHFAKRQNSTLLPTESTRQNTFIINLKDECDLLNPVFEMTTSTDPKWYNYVYVESLGRYYHINRWKYYRGIYSCECTIDVLASYKSLILANEAYILYSTSHGSLNIVDPRNRAGERATISSVTGGWVGTPAFNSSGIYTMTLLSDKCSGYSGGVATYALTQAQMKTVGRSLSNTRFWAQLIAKLTSGNLDFGSVIVNTKWLPFSLVQLGHTSTSDSIIYALDEQLPEVGTANYCKGYLLDNPTINAKAKLNINFSNYAYSDKYRTAMLYLPYYGYAEFDLSAFYGEGILDIELDVDAITGDFVYTLGTESAGGIQMYTGNCATSYPISTASTDVVRGASSIIATAGGVASTVAGIATANPMLISGGIAGTAGGLLSTFASSEVHTGLIGSTASRILASKSQVPILYYVSKQPTDPAQSQSRLNKLGAVFGQTTTLRYLTGYCQTQGASISILGASADEVNMINNALDNGIYIE